MKMDTNETPELTSQNVRIVLRNPEQTLQNALVVLSDGETYEDISGPTIQFITDEGVGLVDDEKCLDFAEILGSEEYAHCLNGFINIDDMLDIYLRAHELAAEGNIQDLLKLFTIPLDECLVT